MNLQIRMFIGLRGLRVIRTSVPTANSRHRHYRVMCNPRRRLSNTSASSEPVPRVSPTWSLSPFTTTVTAFRYPILNGRHRALFPDIHRTLQARVIHSNCLLRNSSSTSILKPPRLQVILRAVRYLSTVRNPLSSGGQEVLRAIIEDEN